ncbi:hypothetical protein OOJ09_31450 [Mesorhizobium qingshengii]|uniref:Uncharacterized protein n=1 Tax=Mesorhizobium qingshengii TaxID=1165689 RepID=A0ABT4R4D3_9HYPH|nr:hypothetical protein [Mesorhizobium qingshengii]MCZ8548693.1 hypothetical protein [Mesorhizobium qingshengii]
MTNPHHYSASQILSICRQFLRGDGRPTEEQLRAVMIRCHDMIEWSCDFVEKTPVARTTDEEFVRALTSKSTAKQRARMRREIEEAQQKNPFKSMLDCLDEAERRLRHPWLRVIQGGPKL